MSETDIKPYRLYALLAIRENVELIAGEPFVRVSDGYILVYTDQEQPPHSIEIDDGVIRKLTTADTNWLWECMVSIAMINMRAQDAKQMQQLSETMAALERALEAERIKAKGE